MCSAGSPAQRLSAARWIPASRWWRTSAAAARQGFLHRARHRVPGADAGAQRGNVWELVSDSRTQPELLGDRIVYLLSELMRDRTKFIGTPTELSEKIDLSVWSVSRLRKCPA